MTCQALLVWGWVALVSVELLRNLPSGLLQFVSLPSCLQHQIICYLATQPACFCCSSATKLRLTPCDPMDCSTPGFPAHQHLLEFAQIDVHCVGDAIRPSHPLSSPSPALNLSQHQGLSQWVSSSHQVARPLEFQVQHQSFQWVFRTDFL